jgi:glycosyltransferase involved in cell wall biosynthesis
MLRRPVTGVLFVNQTSTMSGAERSLLELLSGMPTEAVAGVACPSGPLAGELARRGVRRWPTRGTEVSFRLHPVHTTRGLAEMAADGVRVRLAARRAGAVLLHANTARAGLIGAAAATAGGPPLVVHVRDWLPPGRTAAFTADVLVRSARAVVVNSEHVRRQLPAPPPGCRMEVVHNPVDTARFDPDRVDAAAARAGLGLAPGDTVLAVVGQLTPWKGQDDAVRITAALRDAVPGLRLLIAGSAKFTAAGTRFDNAAYERDLRRLVVDLGLGDAVVFAGERSDVPAVMAAADLVLVPSWQEAFGRVALEAMAMRVPVAVTSHGGPAELVRDGVDGLVLAPRDPDGWAAAVGPLLADPERRAEMGGNGRDRTLAEFTIARHVERIRRIHADVLG